MQSNVMLRQNGTIVCWCRKRKQVMGLRKMRLCKAWDEQNNSLHKNEATRNGKFIRVTPTPPTPPPLTLTLPNYITHVPCWGNSKLEYVQNKWEDKIHTQDSTWASMTKGLQCQHPLDEQNFLKLQWSLLKITWWVQGDYMQSLNTAQHSHTSKLNLSHLQLCNGQKNESYTSYHDLV